MGLMLASGIGIGLLFDLYRVLAHELRIPRWLIPLLDLAYWVIATLFVFRMLFIGNFGQVRIFVFLGLAAGYTIYFLGLSRASVKFIRLLLRGIEVLIQFVIRCVEVLIIRPFRLLVRLVRFLLGIVTAVAMFLYKVVIQLLYPLRLLLRFVGRAVRPYAKLPRWVKMPWQAFRRWLKR
jgi:spore cortex biosynthesis protein YabQ